MKPEQKAKELIDKYRVLIQDTELECSQEILLTTVSKQCALICVDEIIKDFKECPHKFAYTYEDYWQEVKQEIEKH